MFNVGIIARRPQNPIKLVDRQVGRYATSQYNRREYGFQLNSNGQLYYSTPSGYILASGEWFSQAPLADIGTSYEALVTTEAGTSISGFIGTWISIANQRSWVWTANNVDPPVGRVLLEIRDVATQTVQASARFWGPGFAP